MSEQPIDRNPLPNEERRVLGKSQRKQVPRDSHAEWTPAPNRRDPIQLLQAQDKGRLPELLPIKYGRMLASPFAFYRGSAVVMASDLAPTPVSGLDVILCGDAHLSNFGIFATPERNLVFDINDFDEVYPGPWEWDIKRLAASAVLAGRENGFKEKDCRRLAMVAARSYREAMQRFSEAAILDVWYFHVGTDSVLKLFDKYAPASARQAKKSIGKAETNTNEKTIMKLTELVDGKRQFVNNPTPPAALERAAHRRAERTNEQAGPGERSVGLSQKSTAGKAPAAGSFPDYRRRASGRWGRQCGHSLFDPLAGGGCRAGCTHLTAEGGRSFSFSGIFTQEKIHQPGRAGCDRAACYAGCF